MNAVRRRASVRTSMSRIIALLFVATPIIALVSLLISPPKSVSANTITTNYAWNASVQTWTVPYGVSSITVTANGGRGGTGGNDNLPGAAGGSWGRVIGTISVAQGDVIRVFSGGAGGNGNGCVTGTGAGSGGGSALAGYGGGAGGVAGSVGCSGGGGGGGGASVVSKNGANQFIAGGAGGGAGDSNQAVGASYPGTGGTTISGTAGGAGARGDSCSNSSDGGGGGGGGGGANGGAGGSTFNANSGAWECQGYGGNRGTNFIVAGASSTTNTTATTNDSLVTVSYTLSTPSTPNLVDASDSGFSNSDNITNVTTPTFSGTATGGSTVQLQVNGVNSGSTCTANASTGAWSCTTAGLTHGTYSVTAASTLNGVTTVSSAISIEVLTSSGSPPTPTRNGSGTLTNGQTETVRFYFGADVTGFELADVTVSGGSLSSFTGSGRDYSATFTPISNSSGTASISIGANKYTDLAGNSNTSSGSALSIAYETSPPTMTVSASPSTISSGGTSTVTFTASEATSTFALEDVSATLGTLSNFQSASSTSYTATFTAAQSVDGTAVVTVSLGSFTDVAGNASIAAFTGNVTVTNTSASSGGRVSAFSGSTNYIVEQFTSVGDSTWTVPRGVTSVEYLVVGGGGAGGTAFQSASAGGGGGGEVTSGTRDVTENETYTISVGRGGTTSTESPDPGGDGVESRIATSGDVTVASGLGGGGGSSFKTREAGNASTTGYTGGGGGSWASSFSIGSTGTGGASFKGGNAKPHDQFADAQAGGGGGGAGGAGSAAVSYNGGAGGLGVDSSITGTSIGYGGGGGGGKRTPSNGSAGTSSHGGGAGGMNAAGSAGTNGRGGGGGGGGTESSSSGIKAGGVGGSGIVVIRYALPNVSVPDLDATDDLGSSSTDNNTSATTLTFTGSAPVGSTVQLYVDGAASGSTCTANATTGVWSCDTGVLTAGDKVVTAESTTYLASSTETSTSTGLTVSIETTAPTVSNVTSSSTNGTFSVGDSVSIQVVFSEAVTVSGTPQLTLETGPTNRAVDYVSGSGTTTLTFTYTVQAGDSSLDLDYVDTSSLALNGGSIVDAAGNAATLTLPAPGTTGSLGDNKAIVVTSEPTKIVSARTPVGTASGAAFTTQPQVSLQDLGNNVVTNDSSTVVTASVSDGATLVGTQTATAVNGVATFSDLGISGTAGTAYTITYSATYGGNALTVATQSVTPTVGAATQIAITSQPVGDTAGALLGTQPVVKILDSGDNVVTTASASIEVSASGGTLGGTTTVSTTSGVATFTDLTFAGTANTNYTLTFAATGYTSQTSSSFSVGVGAATKLVLTTSANGATYNSAFTTQPVVEVRDAGNNKVTTATNTVTAILSSGTVVGTGNPTLTAVASGGVASFSGLGVSGAPSSLAVTVTYSSGSLTTTSDSITLSKADQTVTFADPADRAWSATAFAVAPTSSAGLTVAISSSTTPICTASGLNITMVSVGTCTIVASQSGNDYYNAASSVTQSFVISQASQTITASNFANRSWTPTTASISSSTATASSGLTVSWSSTTTDVCTVTGTTLALVSSGTCSLTASQPGDTLYSAATDVVRTFVIERVTVTRGAFSIDQKTYGDAAFDLVNPTATFGGTDVAGTWSYVSATNSVATVSGNRVTIVGQGTSTITATFTPTDTGKYNTGSEQTTLTVVRAAPALGALSVPSPNKSFGDAAFSLTAPTATFGGTDVAGSWTYSSATTSVATISQSTVTIAGAGSSTLTATFTPTDSTNYSSGSVTATLTIDKAAPAFSWSNVSATFGDVNATITAPTVVGSIAGSWTYVSATTSVAAIAGSEFDFGNAGTSVVTATFTPTDTSNYVSGGTVTMTISVATADQAALTVTSLSGTYGSSVSLAVSGGTTDGAVTYAVTGDGCSESGGSLSRTNAGDCSVIATMAGNSNYNAVSSLASTVTFVKASQNGLSVSTTSGTYGIDLTLNVSGGTTAGSVTYVATGVGCSQLNGVLTKDAAGDCSVTATMAGDDNYNAVSSSATTVTFNKASQSALTLTSTLGTYGTSLELFYNGGSGTGAISYAVSGTGCSIASGFLNKDAAGDCSVTVTKATDTNYEAASSSATTVTFAKAPNSISFGSISDQPWSAATFTVSPTATSGNTPTITSSTTDVCTISSLTITLVSSGTCSLTASEDGNGNYLAATNVVRTFEIARVTPSAATWTDVTATYGDADQSVSPPAVSFSGSTISGAWTYTSSDTTVVSLASSTMTFGNFGSATVTGSFTPTDAGKYNSISATMNVSVEKIRPLFTWANVSKTYGDAPFSVTAPTVTNSVAGTWTYSSANTSVATLSSATATVVGAGTSTITATFTPADTTNYVSGGTVAMTVTVSQVTPLFSWSDVSATYGDANATIAAPIVTNSISGSWSYASATTSVTAISGSEFDFGNAGTSVITATFTPTDTTNYVSGGTVAMTVTVSQATPLFSWSNVSATYGDADATITAPSVTGSIAGSWSYVSADTSVAAISGSDYDFGNAGTSVVTATFTPTDTTNYVSGGTVTMTISVTTADQAALTVTSLSGTYGSSVSLAVSGGTTDGAVTYAVTGDGCSESGGSLSRTNAGDCSVIATMAGNSNYNAVSSLASTVTFVKASQSGLSVSTTSGTYGIDLTLNVSGGTTAGSVTYVATGVGCSQSGGVLTKDAAGDCSVTATMAGDDNYNAVSSSATTVTFARVAITVTADAKSMQYGSTEPALTHTITSGALVGSDALTGVLARASGEDVGTFAINQGTLANSNYTITYVGADLTITQRPITVTADSASKQYGSSDPTFTFAITTGSLVGQDALTGSLSRTSGSNVGSYALTIGTLANANYAITFVPANLTITQRPITITATAATKEYGAADPSLMHSVTIGSLVGSDTLSGSLTRVSGENVGTYAILRGTVDNTNYDITYTGALLSVTQRPITVTADAQTKEYGANDPQLTYAITTGSMSGSDTFTGTLSRVGGELVGTYAISQGTLANSNYDITYAGADLTVTQRQVTVTADSKSKEYGSGDPQLTYALTTGSLISGDVLSGSLTRVTGENVGDYAINQGNLANSNYNITYVGANLSVTERPITVTAAAATKEYGATDPTFNYALTSGSLVGSDVLAGELGRASGANVGSYAMTIGTLANTNYAITLVPANLTITQRPITVTAADKTKVFGSTDPSLTYSVTSGSLVGSDSFGGALSRTSGETVGTYSITQGSLDNSNYDITFVDGELTVSQATQNALSVTTSQVVYGTSVVLGSTGGSGTGDVTYAVTSAGSAGCSISSDTLTATGDVGSTCTVTATKAQSTNYSVASSSAQTITVIDRAITVTATAVSKTYGDADPTLEYTITSGALVAGDELIGSLDRVSGEDVGTRAINQGTLANANYVITFVAANLTIDPRPITVTATNTVKTFGDADPSLAYTITSGSLVGSDAFTGAISRNSGENIGSYVIGQGTLAHSNYAITFNDGSFDINGANQLGFTLSATDTSVIFQDTTTLSVSGGNGNGAVTYEVTDGTGGCTISGSTLTAVSAGTCVVTAEKEAEGNYNAATSNNITITVTRRAQAIVFAQPLDRNFSTTSFDLAPSADSGRTPALASQTTNVCTVSGMTVTMVNSGTCTLVASIDGTTNYIPATDVTQSFEISPVVPYAPILESLTASDGAISVSFTLGNSGGSALLNHEYSLDDGMTWNPWPTGSITSPLNISNLTNGVQYEVKVRAINAIGTGTESNMLAVTPLEPVIVVAAPVATDESTTTVVSSTTTVSVVTTVTRNRQGRGSTTTIARRAVTTTVASRNGQLTTTTTILLTTTTSSSTSTTATPTTSVERLTGAAERVTTTTVQTATSIFQSFAPTVTVANVPDTIPARLSPTVAAAVVDGKSVEVAVSQVEQQQIVATMGESSMKLASIGESGAMEPLLANGSVAFTRGSTIRVDGSGMLAGSQVAVWMYSTPMQLGTVEVKADGSFAEVLSIPGNVELGGHKIQFVGSKTDGKEFQFAVGVTVVDETALIMNRAGAMTVAQASSLADANVVTVSTLSRDDASKMMLWFLVVLIMVAGLIAAKPKRMGLVVSRVERFEIATPWLSGFTIPRLLMVLVGSLAGFGAANSTYFDVSSPSALWVAIIVALGVLDVVAGGVAGAVFLASVAASGSIHSMTDLRIAMLVAMLSVLPTTIARSIRPSGAHKLVTAGVSMVMHTVVVVALLSLFAPISGMSYVIEQSIVEIAWVTIIAVAGRKALLSVTGSTDDHRATEVPALRLISAVPIGVLVFSSPVTTVWTMTAWAVLVGVVVLGLRIRAGLRAPSASRVFVGSIAAGLILVISATGALIPDGRSTEITGATSVLPIGDLKVIGQLEVSIDGFPRTFVAINTGVGEITFINGAVGQSITIDSHTTDGDRIPLSDTNRLQLVRGQGITINANGYAANHVMNAWLFSDPVQLGNAATNDNGVLKSKFEVPPGPQDGEHTLQLRMVDAEGRLVNVGIPVLLLSQVPNDAA